MALGFNIGMGAGTKQGLDAATVVAELLDRKRRTGLAEQEIAQRERQIAEQEAMNRFTRGKGLIEMGDISGGAPLVGGNVANIRDPYVLRVLELMTQFGSDPKTPEEALTREASGGGGRGQAMTMLRDIVNRGRPGQQPLAEPKVDEAKLFDIMRKSQASKEHLTEGQLFARAILNPEIIPEQYREQFMKAGMARFGNDVQVMRNILEEQRLHIERLTKQAQTARDTERTGLMGRETAVKEAEAALRESENARKHGETIMQNRKGIYDRISAETRNIDDNITKQLEAAGKDLGVVMSRDPTGKDKRTIAEKVEDLRKNVRRQGVQQKLVIYKRALAELRASKDQYGISEMEAMIKDLEAQVEKEGRAPLQAPK
jgi:hypothetical protein